MKTNFKIIVLLVLSLSLLLCACDKKSFGDSVTAEQILNTAVAVETYDNTKTYIKNKTELDSFSMSMWSDGNFEECKAYDLLSDYAICYSSDNITYEISVLKAKNNQDTSELVSLLERRKNTLSEGDKAAYDPNFKELMNDSRIITDGNFVMLLITPDNDAVIKAIENLKQ